MVNDKANQNARKYDVLYDSNSRLYHTWQNMKKRCYNKNVPKYKSYGARGIRMCVEWTKDFQAFSNWAINNGYQDDLTIDRIDVDDDYKPDNCRWVPKDEQMWNRTDTLYVTYKDKQYCMSYILRQLGLIDHMSTIKKRMKSGTPFEEAIKKPFDRRLMIEYNGTVKSIDEWANFYGIKKHTLYRRLTKMKLPFEDAIKYHR